MKFELIHPINIALKTEAIALSVFVARKCVSNDGINDSVE